MYQNFSSNLGENDFVVNVKRQENKFDQIALYPQENDFASFPGLQIPNPIKIEGALSSKTEITKLEGPGEFTKVDTNWVWSFTPGLNDVGQNYTVKFKGDAKRGGGSKDIATQQFSVTVKSLKAVAGDSGIYYPTDEDGKPQPYTQVHFKINGKYTDLNGDYQLRLTLDGAPYKTINEPTYDFVPTFLEMENKKLGITILFKSYFMRDYNELRHDEFTILSPPLNVGSGARVYADEKVVKLKAGYGIDPEYSPIGGDLNVQSDGNYFDNKATKTADYDFTLRLVKLPPNLKNGFPVKVLFTDPVTGGKYPKTITILPKKR
jgi:hypothetical protein